MILKIIKKSFTLIDRILFVKNLNFENYFWLHRRLNFPLKRLDFYMSNGYALNLYKPKKFNEKVMYRHLFERSPLVTKIVDKVEVREYVRKVIGEDYLIPLIKVCDRPEEINFGILPDNYIIKMSHSSGQNIICKNGIKKYDDRKCIDLLEKWINQKYAFQKLIWFVQNIPRRILIEELLTDEKGNIPKDYKFFVFDGKVEMIQVDQERFTNHARNLYDTNWNRLNLKITYEEGTLDEIPSALMQMIALAEKLASEFTFMRVDFYCVESKIYFGELTPCPGGGLENFVPESFDVLYGNTWKDYRSLSRKQL